MKTILSVWNSSSKGKTETIRELAKLLLSTYPAFTPVKPSSVHIPKKGDFILVIDINGIIVGIVSQGDPGTGLKAKLEDLIDTYQCDIIICATRTRGDTVETVKKMAWQKKYDVIRTSTYQVSQDHRGLANQLKARHLLSLLQGLELLPTLEAQSIAVPSPA